MEFGFKFLGKPCSIFIENMTLKHFKKQHGQVISIEYAVLFFIVIAAITMMSTYTKRAVQARTRGALRYAAAEVNGTYKAMYPNRDVPIAYEPYYTRTSTDKSEITTTTENQTPWAGHEGKFETGIASTVTSQSRSSVAPAADAN